MTASPSRGPGLAAAAVLLAGLAAAPAAAFRWSAGGAPAVSDRTVWLTRSVTVTAELEDERGEGFWGLDVAVTAEPAELVRGLGGTLPFLSCTVTGRARGTWTFRALAPGRVVFRLRASAVSCSAEDSREVTAVTEPVELKPVPIWSAQTLEPKVAAPGDRVTLELTLRNDAPQACTFGLPNAEEDQQGRLRPVMAPGATRVVEPADAVGAEGLRLDPAVPVRVRWTFTAVRPGSARFLLSGGGILITTPPVTIRPSAELAIELDRVVGPVAAGRALNVRGRLALGGGGPGVGEPAAGLAWAPEDAATLVASSASSTRTLDEEHPALPIEFALVLLKPGPLTVTVTGGARELDTGRIVPAVPATLTLGVLPPPDLKVALAAASTTVLVDGRVAVTVTVRNDGRSAVPDLAPIVVVRRGRASVTPLSPLFTGVVPGGTAVFRGVVTPEAEGPLELVAQVTARAQRGGERTTTASDPRIVNVLATPRFELFRIAERTPAGGTAAIAFRLGNPGARRIRITAVTVGPVGDAGVPGPLKAGPVPLDLAPGASATLTVRAYLPPAGKPYPVAAAVTVSGTILPERAGFTAPLGPRPLTLAEPKGSHLLSVEPSPVFRPPLDPLLAVEWTLSTGGDAAIELVDAEGRILQVLSTPATRGPGWHRVTWRGTGADGARLPPGKYRIRLAVPPTPAAAAGAGWRDEVPVEIGRL